MQISMRNSGSIETTPESYLLYDLLSLIYGLTDGKLICAQARSQLRNKNKKRDSEKSNSWMKMLTSYTEFSSQQSLG